MDINVDVGRSERTDRNEIPNNRRVTPPPPTTTLVILVVCLPKCDRGGGLLSVWTRESRRRGGARERESGVQKLRNKFSNHGQCLDRNSVVTSDNAMHLLGDGDEEKHESRLFREVM